jgi:hypothetical protein
VRSCSPPRPDAGLAPAIRRLPPGPVRATRGRS